MEDFKRWLLRESRLNKDQPRDEVQSILQELDNKLIGIYWAGIFRIDYKLILFVNELSS